MGIRKYLIKDFITRMRHFKENISCLFVITVWVSPVTFLFEFNSDRTHHLSSIVRILNSSYFD